MKKTIIISLIILASLGTAMSQSIWTLSYEPATPMGQMKDFTSPTSGRGMAGSVNYFINDHISAGITIQWTGFYEKDERHTWYEEGVALTANAWKQWYILPLYLNGNYHFLTDGKILPYAGLSLGVAYIEQEAKIGTYDFKDTKWDFAFAPEVGALIPMGLEKSWGFNLMLRYQVIFYDKNDINMLTFLNYSFGIYWKMYKRGERY
jgi:outer membrane protein